MNFSILRRASVVSVVGTLALAGAAGAVVGLPADGSRVDDDPRGDRPRQDPGVVDAVGGSLVAGGAGRAVGDLRARDERQPQVFVRAFKNGAWVTQGTGTVNGASSASPRSRLAELRPGQRGGGPSIDFAGPGRTVPWATWYEDHSRPSASRRSSPAASTRRRASGCSPGRAGRPRRAARPEHRQRQERRGAGRSPAARRSPAPTRGRGWRGRRRDPVRRPDLRLEGRQADRARDACARHQARGRQRRGRVLLAAGRHRAAPLRLALRDRR